MTIKLFCYDGQLDISDNQVATVEIANKDCFRRVLRELRGFNDSQTHEINILIDDTLIESDEIEVVIDAFLIDVNDKNCITKLHKSIENYFYKFDEYQFTLNELSSYINMHFNNLINGYPLELSSKTQITLKDYLKFLDVKLSIEEESLQDNIVQLINANSIIKIAKVIVFVNLKSMLTQEEINNVIYSAISSRCPILLLENTFDDRVFDNELKLIVDNDLFCMIK